MHNTSTVFPAGVDDRLYLSDMQLGDVSTMTQYQELLAAGQWTQAAQLLENSDIPYYGAWVLNLLENRLVELSRYVINYVNESSMVYSEFMPYNTPQGTNWVGGDELNAFGYVAGVDDYIMGEDVGMLL